jgi:hypothetical protein
VFYLGARWDPCKVVLLYNPDHPCHGPGQKWLQYNGGWCFDGISTPSCQDWWIKEHEHSNTFLRRIFCSFMPACLCFLP